MMRPSSSNILSFLIFPQAQGQALAAKAAKEL
jgi:hypothetical protein